MQIFYKMCRKHPDAMKHYMVASVQIISRHPLNFLFLQVGRVCDYLGQSFAPHFTPSYKPWDQRVCLLPNGDLMQVRA
jgi:monooxygenase